MSLNELLSDKSIFLSVNPNTYSRLSQLKMSATPMLIAISGESAAGKTSFLNVLRGVFKQSAFIDADHYFNDISQSVKQHGGFSNLVDSGYESDAPDSFQLDQLQADLLELRRGNAVKIPFYDMKTGASTKQAQEVNPAPVIFVAGICSLYNPVCDLFDFKIYLQPDKIQQRARYFQRASERGQNGYDVLGQYNRVCEMAEKYIVPTKSHADVVIKGRLPKSIIKQYAVDFLRALNKE